MIHIGIVTDSTAYLTPDQRERLPVEIVSLSVNFGDESFKEGEVYSNKEFYEKLRQASFLPTTSQPSVGDFLKVYEKLAGQFKSIISIHISGGISGTVQAARAAAQMLPHLDITVVDSMATAIGLYFIVEAAVQAARQGLARDEVLRIVNHVMDQMTLLFFPDTLEYLRRGGRIGGAAALIGTVLQVKPVLYFNKQKNGIIDVYEKVRTKERAIKRLLGELEKAYKVNPELRAGIVHVGAPEEGKNLCNRVQSLYPGLPLELCEVGPVIGAHVGPGTLGICFYPLIPELQDLVSSKE
ncbi:MAG: DegV family protein [Bacillota bacterium]|nr:DegV family protein [Bacillota bacterium]